MSDRSACGSESVESEFDDFESSVEVESSALESAVESELLADDFESELADDFESELVDVESASVAPVESESVDVESSVEAGASESEAGAVGSESEESLLPVGKGVKLPGEGGASNEGGASQGTLM